MQARLLHIAVEEVGDLSRHLAVEGDGLLDDSESLRRTLHPLHIGGVVLWREPGHWVPHRAIVDPDPVTDFTAQQLVDRQARCLSGDVPQRHLNRAHTASPGLETPQPADLEHHPFDIGGVLSQDEGLVEHDVRFEVVLRGLYLRKAADALVGRDADHWVLAQDSALQIGDFHLPNLH